MLEVLDAPNGVVQIGDRAGGDPPQRVLPALGGEPLRPPPEELDVLGPVHVRVERGDRLPHAHVHELQGVREDLDVGGVALLGLQPPHESVGSIGQGVDPIEILHELGDGGVVGRGDHHADVDLGDVVFAVIRHDPSVGRCPKVWVTVASMFEFHPISEATRRRLIVGGVDPDAVAALVRMAVAEDLMGGIDVTSVATIAADHRSTATFGAREPGVVAGLPVAAAAIEAVCGDAASEFEYLVDDGDRVTAGQRVARVAAPTRGLLTAERSALNLLCRLSGIASLTRRWADELEGTSATVRDTRKTTPGLRALEKYAVRCGGGENHRFGLSDMALVKDNHVAAAGGVAEAYALVRELEGSIPVEIEVDTLDGLAAACSAGADIVLIDNFDTHQMRAAVAYRNEHAPQVLLEASGGLTLETARSVGETGVDWIAVGELTHSARVLDLGLDLTDRHSAAGGAATSGQ